MLATTGEPMMTYYRVIDDFVMRGCAPVVRNCPSRTLGAIFFLLTFQVRPYGVCGSADRIRGLETSRSRLTMYDLQSCHNVQLYTGKRVMAETLYTRLEFLSVLLSFSLSATESNTKYDAYLKIWGHPTSPVFRLTLMCLVTSTADCFGQLRNGVYLQTKYENG